MPNLDEQSMGGNREKNEVRKPSTPGSQCVGAPWARLSAVPGGFVFLGDYLDVSVL